MSEAPIEAVRLDGAGPVYDQIRRAIGDLITGGAWPPGTIVPPEHALMQRLGASRMTVHRALTRLAQDGLILRKRRSGSVVAIPPANHAMLDILSIPDEVRARGEAYSHRLLARRDGVPMPELAARFGLKRRLKVVHVTLLHMAGATPHGLEERVIHLAAVPAAAREPFDLAPPGDWLLQNSLWSEAEHAISAVAADAETAGLLAIPVGEPCLVVERRTWLQTAPVTAVRLTYPGKRHRFVGRFGPYRGG